MSFMYAKKPESSIQENKPVQKKYAQATNAITAYPSGIWNFTAHSGIIQRMKIKTVSGEERDVDFNDDNDELKKGMRQELEKHGWIAKQAEERGEDGSGEIKKEVIKEFFDFAREHLNGDEYVDSNGGKSFKLCFRSCKDAVNNTLKCYITHLKNNSSEREEPRLATYTIGGSEERYQITQEDIDAIERDELFREIRKAQESKKTGMPSANIQLPQIDITKIDMRKLQPTDFYSRSAMRERLIKYLIEHGIKEQQGVGGRTDTLYQPIIEDEELEAIYATHTFHHLESLGARTKRYQEMENKEGSLQEYQWDLGNLVLGPDRERRIYDSGDVYDCEAAIVYNESTESVPVKKVQTEEKEAQEESEEQPAERIKIESPNAAMRTDYLQYFYESCQKYQDGDREVNPLTIATIIQHRLQRFDTHQCKEQLISSLKTFIENFREHSNANDSGKCLLAVKTVIDAVIQYGKDAEQEEQRRAVE